MVAMEAALGYKSYRTLNKEESTWLFDIMEILHIEQKSVKQRVENYISISLGRF